MFSSDEVKEEEANKVGPGTASKLKSAYQFAKKHWMFFNNFLFLGSEIIDLMFVVTLFVNKLYWFGCIYLSADILPAIVYMRHRFHQEKSWKVLVKILSAQVVYFSYKKFIAGRLTTARNWPYFSLTCILLSNNIFNKE